jgi:hypothetical protein
MVCKGIDMRLLRISKRIYISGIQKKKNMISVTFTARSVVGVVLRNEDFIPRTLYLRLICILVVGLSGQNGKGQIKNASGLSTSVPSGHVAF